MEQTWENWPLRLEMGDEKDVLEVCHGSDDEKLLREILECDGGSSVTSTTEGNEVAGGKTHRPKAFILSFDNSSIISATAKPRCQAPPTSTSPFSSKQPTFQNLNSVTEATASQGGKKVRNDYRNLDHIEAERKRRQELTEKFIALSATIPSLKKTDKTSILREAINYVKQLQERVTSLEQQRNMRCKESRIIVKKTDMCAKEVTTSNETNSNYGDRSSELFPDVVVRVLEKEVLIEIHCEKENGIELKVLAQLQNLHLYVTASSVLPFGNSTLGITIIAQMGDAYKMTVNELVKAIRQVLLY